MATIDLPVFVTKTPGRLPFDLVEAQNFALPHNTTVIRYNDEQLIISHDPSSKTALQSDHNEAKMIHIITLLLDSYAKLNIADDQVIIVTKTVEKNYLYELANKCDLSTLFPVGKCVVVTGRTINNSGEEFLSYKYNGNILYVHIKTCQAYYDEYLAQQAREKEAAHKYLEHIFSSQSMFSLTKSVLFGESAFLAEAKKTVETPVSDRKVVLPEGSAAESKACHIRLAPFKEFAKVYTNFESFRLRNNYLSAIDIYAKDRKIPLRAYAKFMCSDLASMNYGDVRLVLGYFYTQVLIHRSADEIDEFLHRENYKTLLALAQYQP